MRGGFRSGWYVNVEMGKYALNVPCYRDIDVPLVIIPVQIHTIVKGTNGVEGGSVEGVDGVAEVNEVIDCLVTCTIFLLPG